MPTSRLLAKRRCSARPSRTHLHVSIGSFLDLRYLVDSGRLSVQVFEDARSIVDGEAFMVVPLDLPIIDKMALISRDVVPDPFDRIIAATALAIDYRS